MRAEEISIPSRKIKYGLSRTYDFLKLCNNPEETFFSIQIIGTNGKGTVAAFVSQILIDAGYNVGTYSSPHLIQINERVKINNKCIHDNDINYFLNKYYKKANEIQPSFFELMTTMSMWYFYKNNVEIAILETGLGGRHDSVTACKNNILAFTSISMDHHNILGNSIKKIANEKSKAIINSQQKCLSVNQGETINNILLEQAKNCKSSIEFIRNNNNKYFFKNLYGKHQQENATLAQEIIITLKSMRPLPITLNKIHRSINNTIWYGRFQILKKKPTIIYDVAHNSESLKCFLKSFIKFEKQNTFKTKHLIIAFEKNKKIRSTLKKYENHFDHIICSETNIRYSMNCQHMTTIFSKNINVDYNTDLTGAISETIYKSNTSDVVAIVGSHFMAPALDKIFKNCFEHK